MRGLAGASWGGPEATDWWTTRQFRRGGLPRLRNPAKLMSVTQPGQMEVKQRTAPAVERFFQFSLLGLIASAFCALADTGRLDLPSLTFLLAGLLWRGLMVTGVVRFRIPQRLITLIATGYLVFYPLDFYFLSHDFFAATAHGVCFLGVARVLSASTNRDYLYTGSLAFIALMGAAALSTSPRFFGWLTAAIVFGLGALTSSEIRRGFEQPARTTTPVAPRTAWRLGVLVVCAATGILALTAGLFLVIPRTARAAAMLFPSGPRLTGFTNSIDLGGFGAIAKDNRPVLHVHAYGPQLPPNLKWRGSALSQFDGRRWSEPPFRGAVTAAQGTVMVADRMQRSRRDGARLVYRVDVGSTDTGTLFIAGVPEFINLTLDPVEAPRLLRTSEDSFRALPALGEPISYEVSAHNGAPLAYPLSANSRARYLDLPAKLDRRIAELGREWSGAGTDIDRAGRIESHLQRDFTYTLDTSDLASRRDPLAEFLFVTKRGYCEYFASAMAVLLRTQGIPARVATGFQSGYYNDVSGTWVLRASDAHAWVEGWIEGRGWVTFDPTPPGTEQAAAGVWRRMAMYLDAADTAWQQWVVAYNPGQQAALAIAFRNRLRGSGRSTGSLWKHVTNGDSWKGMAAALIPALAAIGLAFVAFRFGPGLWRRWSARERIRNIKRGRAAPGDAALLYERMLHAMARRGFEKPAWFTPTEFVGTLPEGERAPVAEFTATYNDVRFGGHPTRLPKLAEMLETIEARGSLKPARV